jgi:hypothetical protein
MEFLNSFLSLACLLCLTCCAPAYGAANTANILSINTATTSVTAGAYVTLGTVPATLVPSALVIVNNTSSIIKIAYGAASSEIDLVAILPSGMLHFPLVRHVAAGTRIAVEAVDATASTKYITVSLIP